MNGAGRKGDYCTHNNQCKPGIMCIGRECGGKPKGNKEKCYTNLGCRSNACGTRTNKCVPAGGRGKIGEYCTASNQCQPGILCNKNKCGGDQVAVGKSRGSNANCLSGVCDNRTKDRKDPSKPQYPANPEPVHSL